jgi:hypothetical protein
MRRHFVSRAAGLCAQDGFLKAIFRRDVWIGHSSRLLILRRRLDTFVGGSCYSIRQIEQFEKPKVDDGPYRLLRYFEIE